MAADQPVSMYRMASYAAYQTSLRASAAAAAAREARRIADEAEGRSGEGHQDGIAAMGQEAVRAAVAADAADGYWTRPHEVSSQDPHQVKGTIRDEALRLHARAANALQVATECRDRVQKWSVEMQQSNPGRSGP